MWDFLASPAFVVLVGALLAAWAGFWFHAQDKERIRQGFVFLGATISILGAFWTSQRQLMSSEELRKKSDEIVELNKYIVEAITGGNSFAYFDLTFTKEKSPTPVLIHKGEHPLYELAVRIVNLDKFEKKTKHSLSDMKKDDVFISLGTLAAHSTRLYDTIEIGTEHLRLNLFFSARNGFFTESLRGQRVGNEWKTAVQVTKSSPTSGETKTLFEKVDPNYPRGKDGKVEW